ncbi:MAG: hypothetical protein ABI970_01485 [Chloroflexota bacterium]
MPIRDTAETRAVTLVDIPLVRRLSETGGMVLDSELFYTDATGAQSSGLITLLLPYRGVYTMVTRTENQQVAGQFRLRQNDAYAQITYVAPAPQEGEDDSAWLHVLDAMAAEAGKRGAHLLTAEVEESAPLFKTMRIASYAIYARQEIWCRAPEDARVYEPRHAVELTDTTEDDLAGIYLLYGNIVPKLVQPVTELPGEGEGFVYRRDDRVEGYIGVVDGKMGVYLTPHLHPDVFSEAPAVIAAAIAKVERSGKVPVFVRVRRYQDWLDDALVELGFTICARQAVMVKHIAAGVRAAAFTPLRQRLEAVPSPVKPPNGVTESRK